MKDLEANILKAFLATLGCQRQPLPPDLQSQLQAVGADLLRRIDDLETLALQSYLAQNYQQAIACLEADYECTKGKLFRDDPVAEQPDPRDPTITSVASTTEDLPDLKTLVQRIDQKLSSRMLEEKSQAVITSPDSVQACQEIIIPILL